MKTKISLTTILSLTRLGLGFTVILALVGCGAPLPTPMAVENTPTEILSLRPLRYQRSQRKDFMRWHMT